MLVPLASYDLTVRHNNYTPKNMVQYELVVEGMSCTRCEETVSNAIRRVEGVHRVEADHETGAVVITADEGTESVVKQANHHAGYDTPA